MISCIHGNSNSKNLKARCTQPTSTHAQYYNRRSLSASRRILRKTLHGQRRPRPLAPRQPLAVRNISNGARRHGHLVARSPVSISTLTPPTTPTPAAAARLPRTLPRPQLGEVNRTSIDAAYPELAHVPMEYVRKNLALAGNDMLTAIANVRLTTQTPPSTLPRELEIVMNDMLSSCSPASSSNPPTHMLAVYSSASSSQGQKRKVTLFPTHHLVLAAHCTSLPPLPLPLPASTLTPSPTRKARDTRKESREHSGRTKTLRIPTVPLCLPSPETFPILQSYLYTKRTETLFAQLLPAPPASFSCPSPSSQSPSSSPLQDMLTELTSHLAGSGSGSLARNATLINGVWRNACALGVRDDKLWDVLGVAWGVVVGAMGSQ